MKTKKINSICSVFIFGAAIFFLQGCGSSTTPTEPTSPVATASDSAANPPSTDKKSEQHQEQPPTGRSHLRVNSINVSTPSASKDQEFEVNLVVQNIGNAKSNLVNIEIRATVSDATGAANVSAGSGSCHALNPGESGQSKIKIKMSQAVNSTGNFILTPVLQSYQSDIESNPPQTSIIIN